ncbi:hypothetical protein NQ176_g5924 [Zarea fungicola]|uniref:Uncharacterized protein n=1 Tax=Zarea fungicola TaxID=93591 RepID=A0ACC1N5Y1_9HYPO|nr:hypothetical protein NQ176_g5924 [Lecanicillium fungicola]
MQQGLANMFSMQKECEYPPQSQEPEAPDLDSFSGVYWMTDSFQTGPAQIHDAIQARIARVLGSLETRHCKAVDYFQSTHKWLPIIDETLYYQRLSATRTDKDSQFDLLSLCMLLTGVLHRNGEIPSEMMSLYIYAKGAVTCMELVDACSLDLLQCRLLLTVFEIGHGLYPAAYVSVGSNLRTAETIGINAEADTELLGMVGYPERVQEAKCTWMAIMVTSRYISLECEQIRDIFKQPNHRQGAKHVGSTETPASGSAPLYTPSEDIARLNEASRLLGRVLVHVHTPTLERDFNGAEALLIFNAIKAFRVLCKNDEAINNPIHVAAESFCQKHVKLSLPCPPTFLAVSISQAHR